MEEDEQINRNPLLLKRSGPCALFERLHQNVTQKRTVARSKNDIGKRRRAPSVDSAFTEIVRLIEEARTRAYQLVNKELVGLYWRIGKYIGQKLEAAEWGDSVVEQLARHIERTMPGLRGFTRRNLFRMRQFYDAYANDLEVSPLVATGAVDTQFIDFRAVQTGR
jgi:hypothetical protein